MKSGDPYDDLVARDQGGFAENYPPGDLRAAYRESDLLVVDTGRCGLWQADQLQLFCTHPVLHTDGSGPPAGWLTLFQPLDDAALSAVSDRVGLELDLAAPGEQVRTTMTVRMR